MLKIKDRQVQYPNRFQLTPVSGQENVYDLTAVPGTVTQAGTALNKANLLSDATAALLGLTGDPTVNQALSELSDRAKVEMGSYTGTGTSGSSNPNSLTFSFAPKLIIIKPATANNYGPLVIFAGVSAAGLYGKPGDAVGSSSENISWSNDGKTVSWYTTSASSASVNNHFQLNYSGIIYNYIAIG